MKLLVKIYDKVLEKAEHKYAPRYLAAVSFAEASMFPIPPDVMLIPMVIAKPEKAFYFAFLTTMFSVLGGALGYLLGYLLYEPVVLPFLNLTSNYDYYLLVKDWFSDWGFWAVLIAGFTFIPFKLFTICAGVMQFSLIPFLAASFIGRSGRFFLVAFLLKLGGSKLQNNIRVLVEKIGWLVVGFLLFCFVAYKYFW